MSDVFYKSSFFLNYLTLLYDGEQLMYLLMCCTSVRVPSVLFLHNNENLPCASCHRRISLYACSSIAVNVCETSIRKVRHIISKTLIAKSRFKIQENLLAVVLMINALKRI